MRRKHSEHARSTGVEYLASHNPLLRRSDRVQATAKNVVVTLLILMLPIAVWLGMASLSAQQSRVADQQVSVQPATATTTAEAIAAPVASSEFASTPTSNVEATWSFDGAEHSGTVSVTAGTPEGTQTRIWVDRNGDRTTQPITNADAVAAALFTGIGSLFAVALVLFGFYSALKFRLDMGRNADWDKAITKFLDEHNAS